MPVVVVALVTAKPESVDTVRAVCEKAIAAGHTEPGCELYSLHQTGDTFVFIEQWADQDALNAHMAAPNFAEFAAAIGEHVAGAPDIKILAPIPAGDPAKGQLRA